MVDRVEDILDGMRDMRIKQAVLITALRKLGENPLVVSHGDIYDSAAYDIDIKIGPTELIVYLSPAPSATKL